MDNFLYARSVFDMHLDVLDVAQRRPGLALLELGPGDSLLAAVLGANIGASRVYLLDSGPFAIRDPGIYVRAARALGLDVRDWDTIDEMLRACNATYLTNGLESLRAVPDESIDFVWSHAVLEHVHKEELVEFARAHRFQRPSRRRSEQPSFPGIGVGERAFPPGRFLHQSFALERLCAALR